MRANQLKSVFITILLIVPSVSMVQAQDSDRRREGDSREQDRGRDRDRDRRWEPDEFLKRMDTNGDGKLEPSEMSGRTERYLGELGFDTSKPILIKTVSEKIKSDRGEKPSATTSKTPPPKVPGFGATNEKVTGFGKPEVKPLEETFDESTLQQVDQIMKTYDGNQNDFLDGDELVSIPWGPPSYQESDIDRDGKISRQELAMRYKAREQNARAASNNSNPGRRSSRGSQSNREKSDPSDRGRFASDGSSSSSSSSSSRVSRSRSSSEESSAQESGGDRTRKPRVVDESEKKRIEKYADFIFQKYDKDKDQRLSAEEAKDIRNPPKADNDGMISRTAYVEYLLNPDSQKSDKSGAESGDSKSESPKEGSKEGGKDVVRAAESKGNESKGGESSRSSRIGRSRSGDASSSGSSNGSKGASRKGSSFETSDENGNGVVEMHEYSSDWSESMLNEFYEKDKNRDGVITRKEWNGQ